MRNTERTHSLADQSDSCSFVVRLRGGLGNQMFQYAFGEAVAGDRRLLFDASELESSRDRSLALDCFGLDLSFSTFPPACRGISAIPGMWRWIDLVGGSIRLPGGRLIWDSMGGFDRRWTRLGGTVWAIGYWQDEAYFKEVASRIRERFTFVGTANPETRELVSAAEGAVGVQVRRGDYIDPHVARIHPPPDPDYISRAVEHLVQRQGVTRAIVTSDDPDWARAHLDLPVAETIFRTGDAEPWEDMLVLNRCGHVVISNSSFGWWSAWLGEEGRSVVCPEAWYGSSGRAFASPAPDSWIRLD